MLHLYTTCRLRRGSIDCNAAKIWLKVISNDALQQVMYDLSVFHCKQVWSVESVFCYMSEILAYIAYKSLNFRTQVSTLFSAPVEGNCICGISSRQLMSLMEKTWWCVQVFSHSQQVWQPPRWTDYCYCRCCAL